MLDLSDRLLKLLEQQYQLQVQSFEKLPLGADINAAVYQVKTADGRSLFIKLRRGRFDPIVVDLPFYLHQAGIKSVIPPLSTRSGKLWLTSNGQTAIIYPFVDGKNGYEQRLTEKNWTDFGKALNAIHMTKLPKALLDKIGREAFNPAGRRAVSRTLTQPEREAVDSIAADLLRFLATKRDEIETLVDRTTVLAERLRERPYRPVLCHTDLHAGNLLIGPNDTLYIVDWDEALLAPRERDLMYAGGALLASGLSPEEEEALFYAAYGKVDVDREMVTYFRCERIIQDIAAYCAELLDSAVGSEAERRQSLAYLKSNFEPGNTIDAAYRYAEFRHV